MTDEVLKQEILDLLISINDRLEKIENKLTRLEPKPMGKPEEQPWRPIKKDPNAS